MQKINFKNLPDTSTPLNASTLNQMQDNIESAINSVNLSNTILGSTDNLDNLYNELGIKTYQIFGNAPISMPTGAYNYGFLVVATQSLSSLFVNSQFYIPDNRYASGVYVRTGTNDWGKIETTTVSKTIS